MYVCMYACTPTPHKSQITVVAKKPICTALAITAAANPNDASATDPHDLIP